MSDIQIAAVRDTVRRLVAEVLWLPEEQMDPCTPLVEFGLDSAMAIELTVRIEAAFDLDLPQDVTAQLQTINQIVDYLGGSNR